jgi:oligoribonuclease
MEMTGPQPEADRVIEIAMLGHRSPAERGRDGSVLVAQLRPTSCWCHGYVNKSTHAKTGFVERVRVEPSEADVEPPRSAFIAAHAGESVSPMCGNSICQTAASSRADAVARGALPLPHPRCLDAWRASGAGSRSCGVLEGRQARGAPRILESIEELKFYRKNVMTI